MVDIVSQKLNLSRLAIFHCFLHNLEVFREYFSSLSPDHAEVDFSHSGSHSEHSAWTLAPRLSLDQTQVELSQHRLLTTDTTFTSEQIFWSGWQVMYLISS